MRIKFVTLAFILGILYMLGIGVVKNFKLDIPYPVRYILVMGETKARQIDKSAINNNLEEIASSEDLKIYKRLYKGGEPITYVFGVGGQGEDAKQVLATSPIDYRYFSSKDLSQIGKKRLYELGIAVESYKIPLFQAPLALYNLSSLSGVVTWCLLLSCGSLLYAIKTRRLKAAVVNRSLGLMRAYCLREMAQEWLMIVGITALLLIGESFKGLSGPDFLIQCILLGAHLMGLTMVILVTNALFSLQLRLMPIYTTSKKSNHRGIIHFIWLMGVLLMITNGHGLLVSLKGQQLVLNQNIEKAAIWRNYTGYVTLTLDALSPLAANHQQSGEIQLNMDYQRKLKMMMTTLGESWLYVQPSQIKSPVLGSVEFKRLIENTLSQQGIDKSLGRKVYYFNSAALDMSDRILHTRIKRRQDIQGSAVLAQVYLPESLQAKQATIAKLIWYENFQNRPYQLTDYRFISVADDLEVLTPLSNASALSPEELDKSFRQRGIIQVVLNFDSLEEAGSVVSSLSNHSLFKASQLDDHLNQLGLTDYVKGITDNSDWMLTYVAEQKRQLLGAQLTNLAVIASLFFVLYQYCLLQISFKLKQMAVYRLQAWQVGGICMRAIAPLIVSLVIMIAYYIRCGYSLQVVLSSLQLVEVLLVLTLVYQKTKSQSLQILKGDI